MAAVDIDSIEPISHDESMSLQAEELRRAVALLESLDPDDWKAPTDCPDWDVRRLYLHVLGACEAGARFRENVSQLRGALAARRRGGGPLEAALSGYQVLQREPMQPADVVARLRIVAPSTVRGRRRLPAPLRRWVKMTVDGPVHEKWSLGYLIDTIYLRDLWMHRIDASRAAARTMELSADHDGRIVADIVAEWGRRHGSPFVLDLSGPAGGSYVSRAGAATVEGIELDAVEFCRTLAGRVRGDGLLATVVPF